METLKGNVKMNNNYCETPLQGLVSVRSTNRSELWLFVLENAPSTRS